MYVKELLFLATALAICVDANPYHEEVKYLNPIYINKMDSDVDSDINEIDSESPIVYYIPPTSNMYLPQDSLFWAKLGYFNSDEIPKFYRIDKKKMGYENYPVQKLHVLAKDFSTITKSTPTDFNAVADDTSLTGTPTTKLGSNTKPAETEDSTIIHETTDISTLATNPPPYNNSTGAVNFSVESTTTRGTVNTTEDSAIFYETTSTSGVSGTPTTQTTTTHVLEKVDTHRPSNVVSVTPSVEPIRNKPTESAMRKEVFLDQMSMDLSPADNIHELVVSTTSTGEENSTVFHTTADTSVTEKTTEFLKTSTEETFSTTQTYKTVTGDKVKLEEANFIFSMIGLGSTILFFAVTITLMLCCSNRCKKCVYWKKSSSQNNLNK
ncbi:hypothetical protein TKK_0015103 [Trichogramma kaykai]